MRCLCCSRIPSIASKNWVYRQYDHMVRAGTMVLPGSDAAVFLVREADKILAATTDCNGLFCALEPRQGARHAIAEAARNLTCAGAVPLAVTDNLNFGNPHKPENFWQLRECVEGLAEGCRAFDTPGDRRQRFALQPEPAGFDRPHADGRHGRPDRRRGARHHAELQSSGRRHPAHRRSLATNSAPRITSKSCTAAAPGACRSSTLRTRRPCRTRCSR